MNDLIDQYADNGGVMVRVTTFNASAQESTEWMTADAAKVFINGLRSSGNTNYEAALEETVEGHPSQTPEADQTVAYFVSDGVPTVENWDYFGDYIDGDKLGNSYVNDWATFVGDNVNQLFVVGIGNNVAESYLQEVAHVETSDGGLGTVVLVNNENSLSDVLAGTATPAHISATASLGIDPGADGWGTAAITDIATKDDGNANVHFATAIAANGESIIAKSGGVDLIYVNDGNGGLKAVKYDPKGTEVEEVVFTVTLSKADDGTPDGTYTVTMLGSVDAHKVTATQDTHVVTTQTTSTGPVTGSDTTVERQTISELTAEVQDTVSIPDTGAGRFANGTYNNTDAPLVGFGTDQDGGKATVRIQVKGYEDSTDAPNSGYNAVSESIHVSDQGIGVGNDHVDNVASSGGWKWEQQADGKWKYVQDDADGNEGESLAFHVDLNAPSNPVAPVVTQDNVQTGTPSTTTQTSVQSDTVESGSITTVTKTTTVKTITETVNNYDQTTVSVDQNSYAATGLTVVVDHLGNGEILEAGTELNQSNGVLVPLVIKEGSGKSNTGQDFSVTVPISGDDTVYFEAGQTHASSGYRIDPDGVEVGYTYDQTTKTESVSETTVQTTTVITTEITTTEIVQDQTTTAYDITLVYNLDATDGDGDPVSTQFLVTIDANNDGVMTAVDQIPEVQQALTQLGVAAATDDIPGGYTDDDVMVGGAGDDILVGGTGDDILIGGAGDDTLIGGPGADTMTGGAGSDTFAYEEGDLEGVTAGDTIIGFELGTGGDEMELTDLLEAAGTYGITPDSGDASILDVTVDLDGPGGTYSSEPLATVETMGSLAPETTALDAMVNHITPEIS